MGKGSYKLRIFIFIILEYTRKLLQFNSVRGKPVACNGETPKESCRCIVCSVCYTATHQHGRCCLRSEFVRQCSLSSRLSSQVQFCEFEDQQVRLPFLLNLAVGLQFKQRIFKLFRRCIMRLYTDRDFVNKQKYLQSFKRARTGSVS